MVQKPGICRDIHSFPSPWVQRSGCQATRRQQSLISAKKTSHHYGLSVNPTVSEFRRMALSSPAALL